MFASDQYELLDFGEGRKLERFGQVIVDRPAPAAEELPRTAPGLWSAAHARFELSTAAKVGPRRGKWGVSAESADSPWTVRHESVSFELKRTDFGHLGIFPEQSVQWDWIAAQTAAALALAKTNHNRLEAAAPRVLNLFAYTGGSTLAAAAAGAAVTHVDAAQNIVAWARRNAELSGLTAAPVRWIAEDALKFARREINRGRKYDAVILDPPAYGHGPSGEVWQLDQHLPELLNVCRELTGPRPRFVLLTSHAPELDGTRRAHGVVDAGWTDLLASLQVGELSLIARDGRQFPNGTFAKVGQ